MSYTTLPTFTTNSIGGLIDYKNQQNLTINSNVQAISIQYGLPPGSYIATASASIIVSSTMAGTNFGVSITNDVVTLASSIISLPTTYSTSISSTSISTSISFAFQLKDTLASTNNHIIIYVAFGGTLPVTTSVSYSIMRIG
jgi:hypothetical protein